MKIKKIYIIITLILILLLGVLLSSKFLARRYCYELIRPGMSYKQAAAIMGCEGERFNTSMRCYWWYLDNGSMLQVFYDYEGPPITSETLDKIHFEDYFVITSVYLFKPQLQFK